MTTPAELAARHVEVSPGGFAHLQRLIGSWGVLSDLSLSDLLLLLPEDKARRDGLLVVGQVRPTTNATLLRVDLVGQPLVAAQWPLAVEALERGSIVSGIGNVPAPERLDTMDLGRDESDTGEVPAVPDRARLECVPVRHEGEVVAVVVRVGSLEDRRRGGRLEKIYQELYHRLAAMVAAGTYPFAGEEAATEDAPRVGDGLLMVDAEGVVRYASPNAMSALHRMGVSERVEGQRLPELGVEAYGLERALVGGCPVIEEVEHRPDVIVLFHATPLIDRDKVTGAVVLVRDVTEMRRLDRLLLSKDAAIREVHHRVKNNLQTISSLLRLQARRLEPGTGREALREAERRVRSIAVVHEILSREPGDEVPFDEIVTPLVRMAEDSVVSERPVSIVVEGDIGEVPADVATPLAVALAELLQNAVEHAFVAPSGEETDEPTPLDPGHVRLVLDSDGAFLHLAVIDDGWGLPAHFDIAKTSSLGLSIVRDLVTTQLNGSIVMESTSGTAVRITVPVHRPHEGAAFG